MSVSIYEMYDRAETGPKMAELDFDMGMVTEARQLLTRYPEIEYKPENVVPQEDAVADQLFEAALDLATEVGLFVLDTGRVARFSREEIVAALEQLPVETHLGYGKDEVILKPRQVEDPEPPLIIGGPTASPLTEGDAFVRIHQSYVQQGIVDPHAQGG